MSVSVYRLINNLYVCVCMCAHASVSIQTRCLFLSIELATDDQIIFMDSVKTDIRVLTESWMRGTRGTVLGKDESQLAAGVVTLLSRLFTM